MSNFADMQLSPAMTLSQHAGYKHNEFSDSPKHGNVYSIAHRDFSGPVSPYQQKVLAIGSSPRGATAIPLASNTSTPNVLSNKLNNSQSPHNYSVRRIATQIDGKSQALLRNATSAGMQYMSAMSKA